MTVFVLGSLFLFLIIIPFFLLALNLFRLYDQRSFTDFEGRLNRGLTVGRKPLSREMYQFLKTLPPAICYGQFFIRREKDELLIAEEYNFSSFWEMWWKYRTGWAYVAYVDLSQPDGQIDFRVSSPTCLSLIASILLVYTCFFGFFLLNLLWPFGDEPSLPSLFKRMWSRYLTLAP